MDKAMDLICNWTIKKADVWRVGRLIKDYFEIKKPLIDIVEMLQIGELSEIANFIMGKHPEFIIYETHNIVPNVLRYDIAKKIAGIPSASTLEANYVALGDDPSIPTPTDTILGNETKRALFTNRYVVDNIAYLDKFFSSADVSGMTFLEAGVFCDGTASADTGFLLSKINMNETIGPNEVLTINCSIAINSAT